MANRTRHVATLFILGAVSMSLSMAGCAHRSFYKETNRDVHPSAVASKDVKVFKQKEDITAEYVELGIYRGHAPTVDEAMEAATQMCGDKGGNYYILNTAPFKSGNVYKVDGVCAASPSEAAAPAEAGSSGKSIN